MPALFATGMWNDCLVTVTKMQIDDEIVVSKLTGLEIFRRVVRPEKTETRGVFLMLHGLGDHQGCHIEAAELFAEHGFASVGFDWPGNGASEGIRGDIPGVHVAADLIDEHLELIAELFPGKPVGGYAHSTGGFFILRHIALREKNAFNWLWLSSPLLEPRHGKSQILQDSAAHLASLLPKFTISSGVTLKKVRHIDPSNPTPGTHRIEGRHNRVSLRLGADLMLHADDINAVGPLLEDPTILLITQGTADEICPPHYSRELFEAVATSAKEYVLLHGLRHELFREPANDEFMEIVTDWVDQLV
ncbi:lysophospholipase [Verrucomicrobiales bacterium]|nr:lysophospholipase [Verrucomicrobiales bacterium]